MSKGGKRALPPPWLGILRGTAAALGVDIGCTALLALAAIKGGLPENAAFPATAAACLAAALLGGAVTGKAVSPLLGPILTAAAFCVVLAAFGLSVWQSISWTGHGGCLLAAALVGGSAAGLLNSRKKGRRKGRRK